MKPSDSGNPEENVKKARVTPKRVGWIALNIFLPAWEVSSVTRHAGRNVSRLWQRIREVTAGRGAGGYRPPQALATCALTAVKDDTDTGGSIVQ